MTPPTAPFKLGVETYLPCVTSRPKGFPGGIWSPVGRRCLPPPTLIHCLQPSHLKRRNLIVFVSRASDPPEAPCCFQKKLPLRLDAKPRGVCCCPLMLPRPPAPAHCPPPALAPLKCHVPSCPDPHAGQLLLVLQTSPPPRGPPRPSLVKMVSRVGFIELRFLFVCFALLSFN